MKKITTEIFIERINNVLDKQSFDYSNVVYNGMFIPVCIICNKHGEFNITPSEILFGNSGCKLCKKEKQKIDKTLKLVKIAKKVHNNFFSYDMTVITHVKSKVIIICPIHGNFEQVFADHLKGHGCVMCSAAKRGKDKQITWEKFLQQANEIHYNKYCYNQKTFGDRQKHDAKIDICCPEHGSFWQTPFSHIVRENGCSGCSGSKKFTNETFIKKAQNIWNNEYDYSLVDYKNNNTKVKIICNKHGVFEQEPQNHFNNHGCPHCNKTISRIETAWLDYLNIPSNYRQKSLRVNGKLIRTDAYDPNTNTIYELYGDFWHGNPTKFNPDHINQLVKMKFGKLYEQTIAREKFLQEAGYNIVKIWEKDARSLLDNSNDA